MGLRSSFFTIPDYPKFRVVSFVPSFKSMKVSSLISLLSILYTCFFATTTISFKDGNQTDRLALLSIKAKITQQDPMGTLSSWSDSLHVCDWKGITCGRRHRRVTVLDLQSQRLVGTISPYIGNLTFLRYINLNNNSFYGEIPQQVGQLFRLEVLSLEDNSLEGEIPSNISRCINLKAFSVHQNKLVGKIPTQLGSLPNLKRLYLTVNNLSGSIPSSLGNLSSLVYLVLQENSLTGSIPRELGLLKNLIRIDLGTNKLSGIVPPSLYNLSLLSNVSLSRNQFQGNLPFDIGLALPNLKEFSITMNNFTGRIPFSFSNCTELELLQLPRNYFVGPVPINFGNLPSLRVLSLSGNNLGSEVDDDLRFITSLTNCSSLRGLYFNDNNYLAGMLPNSIANLSTKLTTLLLQGNQIYGSIPTGIQNLVGLTRLGMHDNLFTGSIPMTIGKLQNLRALSINGNRLTGQIPFSLGNLTQLTDLFLYSNQLSGRIPSTLGNCRYLETLDLSQNKINGTIPEQVIGLSSISISLDLSDNSLSGVVPLEVGNLKNIGELYLNENKLSGEIPSTIGECLSLVQLNMQGNFFQGDIPPSLSSLKGLEGLNLSHNNLSGMIPKSLEKMYALQSLDLSNNNLQGEVPKEGVFKNISGILLSGNGKLCGGFPGLQLPDCPIEESKKQRRSLSLKTTIMMVVGAIFLMLLVSLSLILYWRKKSKRKPSAASNFDNQSLEMISYNELLKATDGFSSLNLLGTGSFGSVYKAILHQDENPVAVKVLNLQQRGANKSFMAECDALKNVRHRNLLKIITSCSSTDFQGNDFKALIFEFMPNGSLENWLYPSNVEDDQLQQRNLSFEQRLRIAIDVASALDYLHHRCETPLVHRDLKPSNVLLDEDLTAHVGDFGLAKFLIKSSSNSWQNSQTNSAAVKGSIGYVAPEYGMGGQVSTQGDVYSYGILLLEMFTGKRPTDDVFKDGLSLHSLSKAALLSDQTLEIMDSRLLLQVGDNDDGVEKVQECFSSVVRIGVTCSEEVSIHRMSMDSVVIELQHIAKDHVFREVEILHGGQR